MRGWLVVNGFLQSNKFSELYAFLQSAAAGEGIELSVKTSTELFSVLDEGLCGDEKPDFALFWDKDFCLAKRLEQEGVALFNSAEAVRICDDKSLTAVALRGKVRMPKTMLAPKTFEGVGYGDGVWLRGAIETLGFPMVVKEACGSFGKQVYLAKDEEELKRLVAGMGYKSFLLQEFVENSRGRDVRINVVGGQVFCAILRENAEDFRSNITGGGVGKAYEPSEAQAELALTACREIGLDFAGVDVLFGDGGEPILCEVNSSPHFKSTLDCTGKDMSVAILRYIKEKLL